MLCASPTQRHSRQPITSPPLFLELSRIAKHKCTTPSRHHHVRADSHESRSNLFRGLVSTISHAAPASPFPGVLGRSYRTLSRPPHNHPRQSPSHPAPWGPCHIPIPHRKKKLVPVILTISSLVALVPPVSIPGLLLLGPAAAVLAAGFAVPVRLPIRVPVRVPVLLRRAPVLIAARGDVVAVLPFVLAALGFLPVVALVLVLAGPVVVLGVVAPLLAVATLAVARRAALLVVPTSSSAAAAAPARAAAPAPAPRDAACVAAAAAAVGRPGGEGARARARAAVAAAAVVPASR